MGLDTRIHMLWVGIVHELRCCVNYHMSEFTKPGTRPRNVDPQPTNQPTNEKSNKDSSSSCI
jgi:hypothetical protein